MHRVLTSKSSPEPGQWRTARVPFIREIADNLSALSPIQETSLMKGHQIAGTETLLNWFGYIVHHAPGPALMVQPTVNMAERVSKQRLAPMIEATPALRDRVASARSRDSGNTITEKEFPGGIFMLIGANSAAAFRSSPIRYFAGDEIDAWPSDVEGEGDPIKLGVNRTTNYTTRRKVFLLSTPTLKHASRIEKAFLRGDQRRYFVPCPHCGHMDWLRWENIRWDDGAPETAALVCVECGSLVEERHKMQMLERGEWRPTAEGRPYARSYHLSSLYSPWKTWAECAVEFVEAKDDPVSLKAFVNQVLAETWEERAESADPTSLLLRREEYAAEVPNGVGVLVAAVDVQGDRLEAQVKGYGAGEESWLIAHHVEPGDPQHDAVWLKMDAFLTQGFTHESGRTVKVERVCVDSGGHHTDQVYRFCKARESRGVYAVRGGNEKGKPLVGRPTRTNRYRAALFTLCTDTAKEKIMARLRIGTPGPGYVHLPLDADEEYVAQLTAEKRLPQHVAVKGSAFRRTTYVWTKTRERNEALDLEVYCMAALDILGAAYVKRLPEFAAKLAKPLNAPATPANTAPKADAVPTPAPTMIAPRRASWTGVRRSGWWKR